MVVVSVPLLTVVLPVYELLPASTSEPGPAFVRFPPPLRMPESVRLADGVSIWKVLLPPVVNVNGMSLDAVPPVYSSVAVWPLEANRDVRTCAQ